MLATSTPAVQTTSSMRRSDGLWFGALAGILLFVAWHGSTMVREAIQSTAAVENAVHIRDWFKPAEGPVPQSEFCKPGQSKVSDCLQQLVSAQGPLNKLKNTFNPKDPVFADDCSISRPESLGAILVWVGTSKSSTDVNLDYKPLADQVLTAGITVRLVICGRLHRRSTPIDIQI